ncbi:hypothetical protein N5P37_004814 [Trichoderma harzianum]|nr:hypothetical protein N5P37_004814 [Trichoderma harzianum]
MFEEQGDPQSQKTHGRQVWNPIALQSRASKTFEFIASDSVGRPHSNVRKLIRSHVMRGKNKKRHRVQKLKQGSSEVAGVTDFGEREKNATSTAAATLTVPSVENKNVQCPDTIVVYTSTPTNQAHVAADGSAIIVRVKECGNQAAIVSVLAIASPLKPPHDLALTKFACPLHFSSQALLYRYFTTVKEIMYPANWCVESDNFNWRFFRWLFKAESYLQSILFSVSAFQDILSFKSTKGLNSSSTAIEFSPETRCYLGNTISLLNKQLQDCHMQLHDSTVAVVISLAMIADAMGDTNACKTHIKGLKQMIRARGGLGSFRSNGHVQMKICRIDLGWSLKTGCPSTFLKGDLSWDSCFDKATSERIYSQPNTSSSIAYMLRGNISHKLFTVFTDMQKFSLLVNTFVSPQNKLKQEVFQDAMISIQYRLLSLRYPLDAQFLDEAVRISLLAYQASIFLYIPGSSSQYEFLASQYHSIIQGMDDSTVEAANFKLWMLFVGAFIFHDTTNQLLYSMIANLTRVSSWTSVRNRLKDIMWIDVIHDNRGKDIFQASSGVARSHSAMYK